MDFKARFKGKTSSIGRDGSIGDSSKPSVSVRQSMKAQTSELTSKQYAYSTPYQMSQITCIGNDINAFHS